MKNKKKILIMIILILLSITIQTNVKSRKKLKTMMIKEKLKNESIKNSSVTINPKKLNKNNTSISKTRLKLFNLLSNFELSYDYFQVVKLFIKNQKFSKIENNNFTIYITNNPKIINAYLIHHSNHLNKSILLKNLTLFSDNFSKVEKEITQMINASYCVSKFTLNDVFPT